MAQRITKICPHCKKDFEVYPSGAKRIYCSRACTDAAKTTSERRDIVCKRCGEKFTAAQDHGKWPVYCSRKCFEGDAPQPTEKVCISCGGLFIAGRASHETPDGLRTYCSEQCRNEGHRNGQTKICLNCGDEYYLQPSKQQQRPVEGCCSEKCQHEYYVLDKKPNWSDGKYIDTGSGQRRQLCKREDAASPYLAEHRIIAARFIGRFLERTEPMLHLNDQQADNRPENLFICASLSELGKRRNGSLPWPKEGNLSSYGKS